MSDAISGSNTKPSAVLPLLPIPLTSTPLTTVAEPGTATFCEERRVGGDAVVDYPVKICVITWCFAINRNLSHSKDNCLRRVD